MGLRDYDDYNYDDRRGRRGTRKTAVVIAFGILIALIILVVYLIANPDKKVEIAEKKTSENIKSEEKAESTGQSGKGEKLFNFTTQSSPLTGATEAETKESDVIIDTSSDSSLSVIEVPESEIVEVEVFPEETAEPEVNETPVVDESVYEQTHLDEETSINEEPSQTEIIHQEENAVEEESVPLEEMRPEEVPIEEVVSSDEVPVEEVVSSDEVLVEEEITSIEEEPPVDIAFVEENIEEEEVPIIVAEQETEDESVADDGVDIEEVVCNPFEGVNTSSVVKASEGVFDDGRLIITGKSGSAVYSLYAGEVVETGRENGLKYVIVRSDEGRSIKYSGFERVSVKKLSIVKESALLGSIGSSTSNTIIIEYTSAE